jgi:hypothetical protein
MCFVRCRSGRELRAYDKYVGRGFGRYDMGLPLCLREFDSERFIGDELTHRVVFSGVEGMAPKALRSIRFVVRRTGVMVLVSEDSSDSE